MKDSSKINWARWTSAVFFTVTLGVLYGGAYYLLTGGERPTYEFLAVMFMAYLVAEETERRLKERDEKDDIIRVPIPMAMLEKGFVSVRMELSKDEDKKEDDPTVQ